MDEILLGTTQETRGNHVIPIPLQIPNKRYGLPRFHFVVPDFASIYRARPIGDSATRPELTSRKVSSEKSSLGGGDSLGVGQKGRAMKSSWPKIWAKEVQPTVIWWCLVSPCVSILYIYTQGEREREIGKNGCQYIHNGLVHAMLFFSRFSLMLVLRSADGSKPAGFHEASQLCRCQLPEEIRKVDKFKPVTLAGTRSPAHVFPG